MEPDNLGGITPPPLVKVYIIYIIYIFKLDFYIVKSSFVLYIYCNIF